MKRMEFYEAFNIMTAVGCELNADFHTLDSNQVGRVLTEAQRYGYRKPKNANGSKARYFFAFIQRTVASKLPSESDHAEGTEYMPIVDRTIKHPSAPEDYHGVIASGTLCNGI